MLEIYNNGDIRIKKKRSNLGIEVLKQIRTQEDMCLDFKKERKKILEERKKTDKDRDLRSLKRTKNNIRTILKNNLDKNDWFLTLTFKDNMQDYDKANASFHYFMRIKNKGVRYLVIKELQERGAIHYHCVVFNHDNMLALASSWSYGWSDFRRIINYNINRLTNYLTKYFNKSNQFIHQEKKVFSYSRNLNKSFHVEPYLWDYVMKKYNYDVDVNGYDWLKFKKPYYLAVAYFGEAKVSKI